jgi:hypothetical protein
MGEVLSLQLHPPPMPTLDGPVKDAYQAAYGEDELRSYEDADNKGHGGTLLKRAEIRKLKEVADTLRDLFLHQPCHDAESVFWVIVAFLLRALPIENQEGRKEDKAVQGEHEDNKNRSFTNLDDRESDEDNESSRDSDDEDDDNEDQRVKEPKKDQDKVEDTNHRLDTIWDCLAMHPIGALDCRVSLLNLSAYDWKAVLHHKLDFLAPMLVSLARQVEPEYRLVDPPPHELHLHEAMQRILFTSIWDMKDSDPISLDRKLRTVTVHCYDVSVSTAEASSFGSKRSLFDDDQPPTKKGKSELPFLGITSSSI